METTLDLPTVSDQHAFNLERWAEICADPVFASYDFRVESDRFGHAIMMPPPGLDHGDYQFTIGMHLQQLMRSGKVFTECPVSTSEGVKGVDVAWISARRITKARRKNVLVLAPEICVEVISPSNTRSEIEEKRRLYFEAGAEEVWLCDGRGRLSFFHKDNPGVACPRSTVCPKFPQRLDA